MQRTVEIKLYLNAEQEATLATWLDQCCWLYNQALEQRIKAYRRRQEHIGYNEQCAWLTDLRQHIASLQEVPVVFARDALRRLDRAFDAFFRRCKDGARKPGFPRFKAQTRYESLEYLPSPPAGRSLRLIGFEKLNIKGLAQSRLAKSVHDAAWGMFLGMVVCKAAGAGKHAIAVDARGTSQECPCCGRVAPKSLSERVHRCPNGCPVLDRDQAAALVLRARALRVVGANACGGIDLCAETRPGVSRPGETGSPTNATHS